VIHRHDNALFQFTLSYKGEIGNGSFKKTAPMFCLTGRMSELLTSGH